MKDTEVNIGKEQEKQNPLRIIIENPDGSVRYLGGEDATTWIRIINGLVPLSDDQDKLRSFQWQKAGSLQDFPQAKE
jgi:hypothetical protein